MRAKMKLVNIYIIIQNRYNQSGSIERSTLQEFLASAEPLNANSPEAREIFAPDHLLSLGHRF
jgi:hypothetical protein